MAVAETKHAWDDIEDAHARGDRAASARFPEQGSTPVEVVASL